MKNELGATIMIGIRTKIYSYLMYNNDREKKANQFLGTTKKLTLKQMLQRLLITPAYVKMGKTCEDLPKQICQIIYSLFLFFKKKHEKGEC